MKGPGKMAHILAVSMIMLLVGYFFASGCATRPEAAPSVTPATTTAARVAAKGWQEKWDGVLAAAKKEGVAVIASTWSSDFRVALSKAFKDKYGVELEFVQGTSDEIFTKIQKERSTGLYLEDIVIMGVAAGFMFKRAEFLETMRPSLILPEVLDNHAWLGGKLHFIDPDETVLAFLTSTGSTIVINTEIVGPKEIISYRSLLEPKWKENIVWLDPSITGPGNAFGAGLVEIMGLDFLNELAKQKPIITRDKRLQMEWVARGKYPICLGPDPVLMAEFTKIGAPIQHIIPSEGTLSGGGAGGLFLLNKPAHPNAAKLLLNWFLSQEGQTTVVNAAMQQSRRVDVSNELVDPARRIQPGVKYFDSDSEAFAAKKDDLKRIASQIFAETK